MLMCCGSVQYTPQHVCMLMYCDINCQAEGTQLTLIASMMSGAYGIACLNALFMFIGAWRHRWRICSIFCTFLVCLLQIAVLVVSIILWIGPYGTLCGYSNTNTAEGFRWTMHDDIIATRNLWIFLAICVLPFFCCGMCSTKVTYH